MYSSVWLLLLALLAIGIFYFIKTNRQRHLGIDQKLKVFIETLNDCAFYQQAIFRKASPDEFSLSDIDNKERINLKVLHDKLLCRWEYNDGKEKLVKELQFPYKNDYSESIQLNMVEEVLIHKIVLFESEMSYG